MNIQNTVFLEDSDRYSVIFDGRQSGIVVEVYFPPAPATRKMETQVGNYLQFGASLGNIIGSNDRNPLFLNYFIHGPDMASLGKLMGKNVVGHPVIVKKTLSDKRAFIHVDIHLSSVKAKVTHKVVASANPPGENWWNKKCGRGFIPEIDLSFPLPEPATGIVALVKQ